MFLVFKVLSQSTVKLSNLFFYFTAIC